MSDNKLKKVGAIFLNEASQEDYESNGKLYWGRVVMNDEQVAALLEAIEATPEGEQVMFNVGVWEADEDKKYTASGSLTVPKPKDNGSSQTKSKKSGRRSL